MQRIVAPAARRFHPDIILTSERLLPDTFALHLTTVKFSCTACKLCPIMNTVSMQALFHHAYCEPQSVLFLGSVSVIITAAAILYSLR